MSTRPTEAYGKKLVYKHSVGVILTFIFSLVIIGVIAGVMFLPYAGFFQEIGNAEYATGYSFVDFAIGIFNHQDVAAITALKQTFINGIDPNNTIVPVACDVFIYFMLLELAIMLIFTAVLIIATIIFAIRGHAKNWKFAYSLSKHIFYNSFLYFGPIILLNIYNAFVKQHIAPGVPQAEQVNCIFTYIFFGLLLAMVIALHIVYRKCFKGRVYVKDEATLNEYIAEIERETGATSVEMEPYLAPEEEVAPAATTTPEAPTSAPEAPATSTPEAPSTGKDQSEINKSSLLIELPTPADPDSSSKSSEKPSDNGKFLPKNIKHIGGHAFSQNTVLEEANIPLGIETLGPGAFANCVNLRKVFIPESVKKIEYNCFFNCIRLEKINYGGTRIMWRKIKRGSNWLASAGTNIIICRDGAISVDTVK